MSCVSILVCFATPNIIINIGWPDYWFQHSSQASRKEHGSTSLLRIQNCSMLTPGASNLIFCVFVKTVSSEGYVMGNQLTYMKDINFIILEWGSRSQLFIVSFPGVSPRWRTNAPLQTDRDTIYPFKNLFKSLKNVILSQSVSIYISLINHEAKHILRCLFTI